MELRYFGGLTVADCQNPNSPQYPGADGLINLVDRVVTSPLLSISAAVDGFFVSDPGGGPYSGILVTVTPGEVTVARDELVDIEETVTWVDSLEPGPELLIINGAEHFFHGRLAELREAVMEFAAEYQ